MPPTATRPARRRARAAGGARPVVSPERWIDAATEVLVDHGIDAVRVDALAVALGVTRGSFYHHFRDRDDLLRRLLQAWRERATEQLTARLASARSDPREQLEDVLSLPLRGQAARRAARIELALRAWARSDAMARRFVDEADASRLAYIAQVFSACGVPLAQARHRAFLLYSVVLAESLLEPGPSTAQRQERTTFALRLLSGPLA